MYFRVGLGLVYGWFMVGCGLACPGGGGAGVSGCEFRESGWRP